MEYLKRFDTENDYLGYRDGKDYIKPNVSLCDGNSTVYYNYVEPPITYDYVDLGLSSGTKWATKNVGARKPSDYGLYFQWGDTSGYTKEQVGTGEGQKKFARDWSDYKWNPSHDGKTFTKYTKLGDKLELEDDAAHVYMGDEWHMPSTDQISELINETTTAWTTSNGVSGMTFTSQKDNSKSIFIPAASAALNGQVENGGLEGCVWSSILNTEDFCADFDDEDGCSIDGAEDLVFDLEEPETVSSFGIDSGDDDSSSGDDTSGGEHIDSASNGSAPRYFGFSVRGVIDGK